MEAGITGLIIRDAILPDGGPLCEMLEQLGYPETAGFITEKIQTLTTRPDARLLVAELDGLPIGLISIHFIPQLALRGDFARISYFVVAETTRNLGIGRAIESKLEVLARERGCDRIEVHCHTRRTKAHRFYVDLGYEESPKYFIKRLR